MTAALLVAAIFVVPFLGTTLFVVWNTLVCWAVARRAPMDAVQAEAFADRSAGVAARAWAILREGWFQHLIWTGDLLHVLGVRREPTARGTGTPVLLLPGYSEGKGAMGYLGRWLDAQGFRVRMEAFPSTLSPIADNVAFVRKRVEAILAETGEARVALVGHSMGGVIARAYVHAYADPRVAVVVCFGSPQRGSILAAFGIGRSAKDMRVGSEHYRRTPIEQKRDVSIHSLMGTQDHIVSPPWSFVTLEGENHVLREPCGHDGPMFLAEGRERLVRWLVDGGVRRASDGGAT